MPNRVRLGGLLLASSLLAFVLVAPRTATSQTRSIGGGACPATEDPGDSLWDYSCPLTTDSTTYTVPDLSGAWFDFGCSSSSQTVVLVLNKFSWTGTLSFDFGFKFCGGESHESEWLAASNVLSNADQWDHLWSNAFNLGAPTQGYSFYGVTLCFSGGANDCL
jgi:hypothetical protein